MRISRLISLKDRRRHAYEPRYLGGIYKLFFLGEVVGGEARPSEETTDVGFFALEALPPLSLARTLAADIEQARSHWESPALLPTFD